MSLWLSLAEFGHPGLVSASLVSPYHLPRGVERSLDGGKHDGIRPTRSRIKRAHAHACQAGILRLSVTV
jgi:hypothetical protein